MVDVLVAGAGPAGLALAGACARLGLSTTLVDPTPHAPWTATYGLWADRSPVPVEPLPAIAHAVAERPLARRYAVLDNESVRTGLSTGDVTTVADSVASATYGPRGATVRLSSGRRVACAVVVDASGPRRVLTGGPVRGRAEQRAYGVVVAGEAAPAVVMDWRPVSTLDTSTFLYSVPLPGNRLLYEETSLAHRPGVPIGDLRARLLLRLAERGIEVPAGSPTERVRIPLDLPRPALRGPGPVAFGAAAALVHPATGYSVADSLHLAPVVAAAIAGGLARGPAAATLAARRAVWPRSAVAVDRLRRAGLRSLLRMPPVLLPQFFELFFTLPEPAQRAYLSGRTDVAGTVAAMAALFRAASPSIRGYLIGWGSLRSVGDERTDT